MTTVWHNILPDAEAPPAIADGRGSPHARSDRASIRLPKWSRIVPIILHETGHSALEEIYGPNYLTFLEGHGPEFAYLFIHLLDKHTNLSKEFLLDSAAKYNVAVADMSTKLQQWMLSVLNKET